MYFFIKVKVLVAQSCPTLCDPMDFRLPGKNTGVGCHSLLQGIFLTHGLNPSLLSLLHWQAGSLSLALLLLLLFSRSVVSDPMRSHGLQHPRHPCPSPTLGACSNTYPLSRWYHPAISPSVVPFSSCPQSFPASGSFPASQLFTSGGPSTGDSASASVLPMNIQGWFPLGLSISLPWKPNKLYEKTKHTTWEAPFMWTYIFNSFG